MIDLLVASMVMAAAVGQPADGPAHGPENGPLDGAATTVSSATVADAAVAFAQATLELAAGLTTTKPVPPPSVPGHLRGLAALVRGDLRSARTQLPAEPPWAVYRSMAEMDRPGGLSRARSLLAVAVESTLASPDERSSASGAMFLAALAFFEADQINRAHALLKAALQRSPSVLDEAWAPDPAVALVLATLAVCPTERRAAARLVLAEALIRAGRRGAGRRLIGDDTGPRAARIRWSSWEGVDPRRAVAAARRGALQAPEMALVVAAAEFSRRREAEVPAGDLSGRRWEARRDRLQAEMALAGGRAADALDAARAAARREPDNTKGIALIVRALIAGDQPGRARAFADVLLTRRPLDVNPYRWMIEVERAEGRTKNVRDLGLRADGWAEAQRKLRRARVRRERILAAARDADAGLGVTGLQAVRADDPTVALTIDLALAKHGAPGTARAARDRILASCAPHLRAWLERRGGWDEVRVSASPYGQAQTVRVRLSDADPGRCPGAVPQRQRPR